MREEYEVVRATEAEREYAQKVSKTICWIEEKCGDIDGLSWFRDARNFCSAGTTSLVTCILDKSDDISVFEFVVSSLEEAMCNETTPDFVQSLVEAMIPDAEHIDNGIDPFSEARSLFFRAIIPAYVQYAVKKPFGNVPLVVLFEATVPICQKLGLLSLLDEKDLLYLIRYSVYYVESTTDVESFYRWTIVESIFRIALAVLETVNDDHGKYILLDVYCCVLMMEDGFREVFMEKILELTELLLVSESERQEADFTLLDISLTEISPYYQKTVSSFFSSYSWSESDRAWLHFNGGNRIVKKNIQPQSVGINSHTALCLSN